MTGRGLTPFQEKIYRLLETIPSGRVVTYTGLARRAGCGSARAVGQALRRNPSAPRVPCHRVIASDLSPGGYQGCRGGSPLNRKLALLAGEGVRFSGGRLEDPRRVLDW